MNAQMIHFIGFRIVMPQIPIAFEPLPGLFFSKLNEILSEWLHFTGVLRNLQSIAIPALRRLHH